MPFDSYQPAPRPLGEEAGEREANPGLADARLAGDLGGVGATTPSAGDIRIVVATNDYVVVEKPSGMLSVPGKGPEKADCVASRVRARFLEATGPLIVHRLDMDTSGLMVLGLTAEAQRKLSAQFEARTVTKHYVALLDGIVDVDSGSVALPMRPDVRNRPWQMIDYIHGRAALTHFMVMARETDRTRVRFSPVTGRAHQLRVHAATMRQQGGIGHAIIGDVLYHPDSLTIYEAKAPRLMLHASELTFNDPVTGAVVTSRCGVPF